MKFKSVYITKAILGSNILFALLLLLSNSASIINPGYCWPIIFIGLAYPFFLIINIIYFIFWLIKLSRYALLSGLIILLGWGIMLNCFELNFQKNDKLKKKQADGLRIMAYNVHNFNSINPPFLSSDHQILKLIRNQNPDVITFEEFNVRSSRFSICDSLKKVFNYYYFEPFIKTPDDSTGLAIFSKLPILAHNILRLSSEESDNQGIWVDIKSPSGMARVYCFHLQSIMLDRRDRIVLQHKRFYKKMYLKGVLEKIKSAYITRAQQAHLIKQQVKDCPYPYIFAGDFNDTPNSYAFHQLADGLKNAFREKGCGWGITYNSDIPIFQIDYILTSPKWNIASYQIIKQKISDHYAVLADVSLK